MIYVTHDQVEAMTMADKIVVLQAGLVEQVGSPLELYHHPSNLFVAGFIGSPTMNFLKTEVRATQADSMTVGLPGGVPSACLSSPENAGPATRSPWGCARSTFSKAVAGTES
jgi:ABC-type sugar transport systems, ATPase components